VRSLRALAGLTIIAFLCLFVSGCAESGSTTHGSASAAKTAYIAKADALCKSELTGLAAVLVSVNYSVGTNGRPRMTSNLKSATRSAAPMLAHERRVLAKLVALPMPTGSRATLRTLWRDRAAELTSEARSAHFLLSQPKITNRVLSEDLTISEQSIHAMRKYQMAAKRYGMTVCGTGTVA
jgi:hypothetical protein